MITNNITLICGIIGSGKSVVSRMLRIMGYTVYDSDSEAKRIMDTSAEIIAAIKRDVCEEAVVDGVIDRRRLADAVFADKDLLNRLNAIVHTAVRNDIIAVAEAIAPKTLFVETAIPNTSNLCKIANRALLVDAPEDIRIQRVMARNSLTAKQVEERIYAQRFDTFPRIDNNNVTILVNDGIDPLLPQLLKALPHS